MTAFRPRLVAGFLALGGLALATLACSAGESRPAAASAASSTAAGNDLRIFIARREQCDHFRGEETSSTKRQAELDLKLKEFCAGTDAQLAALKKKYRNDKNVSKTLAGFDARIE